MSSNPSHIAFSDESGYNKERFQSFAALSVAPQEEAGLSSELTVRLDESVNEPWPITETGCYGTTF